jgi:hypothetical protein
MAREATSAASNVYVLRSGHGLVKVGIFKNPEKRARSLRLASGLVVEMAYSQAVAEARDIERAVHQALHIKRRCGEWFDVSVEDAINAVEEIIKAIDALPASVRVESLSIQGGKTGRKAQLYRWRARNLERYNAYQRDLMRKRRALLRSA